MVYFFASPCYPHIHNYLWITKKEGTDRSQIPPISIVCRSVLVALFLLLPSSDNLHDKLPSSC